MVEAPQRDLLQASEAFLSNSLIGIWPLKRVDAQEFGPPGPLTQRLQTTLAQPMISDTSGE